VLRVCHCGVLVVVLGIRLGGVILGEWRWGFVFVFGFSVVVIISILCFVARHVAMTIVALNAIGQGVGVDVSSWFVL